MFSNEKLKIIKIIKFIAKIIAAMNLGYTTVKHKSPSKSSKSSHRKSSQNHRMFFSEKQRNMSKSIKTKATARLTKSEHKQRTTNTQGERSPSDFETPNALAQQLPMMYRDCSP